MRKSVLALFTATFVLLSGVIAGSVVARPVPVPVEFGVTGRFSPSSGIPGLSFTGTLTVDGFTEEEAQLAVRGTLVSDQEGLFEPLAVTVFASTRAFEDTGSGCTVEIGTVGTFIDLGFIIDLDGAEYTLSQTDEPDAARELCRVVQTATRDPADQSALARALNKVVRGA